jgi:4-amino-4-deoxy-L-arabinose transferase-like glycosyltransferase
MTTLRAHDFNGKYVELASTVDKRPMTFVCLLALVHDLTGYRVANVFILNAILSFALLAVLYGLGRLLGGHMAGLLAVVAWSCSPLVAINATGGGFELLNVLLMATLLGVSWFFWRRRDRDSVSLLALTAVLLAETRYESVIFVLPVGVLILTVWWREQRLILSWPLLLAPLFLVVYPLQHKVFNHPRYWEMTGGKTKPFSAEYLFNNIGHAANYFFGLDTDIPSSAPLATIGAIAIGLLIVSLVSRGREYVRTRTEVILLGGLGAGILANFALMLFYHWADFDTYVVHRFTLPLQLLMVLALIFALREMGHNPRRWSGALAVAGIYFWAAIIPFIARDDMTKQQLVVREVAWQREFLTKHQDEHMLFSTPALLVPYLADVAVASPEVLSRNEPGLKFVIDEKVYDHVYVFQRLKVDPATGKATPEQSSMVSPNIELETIAEKAFVPLMRARISIVRGIKNVHVPSLAEEAAAHPDKKPVDIYMTRLIEGLP